MMLKALPIRTVWELHFKLEETTLPDRLVFAGYSTIPALQIEGAFFTLARSCNEAERVIFAPLLSASKSGRVRT